jgi:hypothetical protein
MKVHAYDFDGVINMGLGHGVGIHPRPGDIIITGRSWQEATFVYNFLKNHEIECAVFFNPLPKDGRTRETSGEHKVRTIKMLQKAGVEIDKFFEDDEVQHAVIAKALPNLKLVKLTHEMGRHG